jgi:hypothetical protein
MKRSELQKPLKSYIGCWIKLYNDKYEKITNATEATLITESGRKFRVGWHGKTSYIPSLDVKAIYTPEEFEETRYQ